MYPLNVEISRICKFRGYESFVTQICTYLKANITSIRVRNPLHHEITEESSSIHQVTAFILGMYMLIFETHRKNNQEVLSLSLQLMQTWASILSFFLPSHLVSFCEGKAPRQGITDDQYVAI